MALRGAGRERARLSPSNGSATRAAAAGNGTGCASPSTKRLSSLSVPRAELAPLPPIYPDDPLDAAQAASLCQFIGSDTAPLQARIVQRYLASAFDLNDDQIHQWVTHWIRRGLEPVEAFMAQRPQQTPFALGANPGVVDIFIVPQMRNADRFDVDIADLNQLVALNETCLAHPAFQAAHPDRWAA